MARADCKQNLRGNKTPMSMEADLFTLLSGDATIAAIVGTRIYPVIAPNSAVAPFLVYNVISGQAVSTFSGASGYVKKRVQISSVAVLFGATAVNGTPGAVELAAAVLAKLQGYSATVGGTWFQFSDHADTRDMWEDTLKMYRRDHDFEIQFSAAP